MKKEFFQKHTNISVFLFFGLFVLLFSACTPTASNLNQDTEEDIVAEDVVKEQEVEDTQVVREDEQETKAMDNVGNSMIQNVEFVQYTNKAVGYTIMRPEKWYWEHTLGSQIDKSLGVEDILRMRNLPLHETDLLGTFGQITIGVVSKAQTRSELDFDSSETVVSGVKAIKYTGDHPEFTDVKRIEYHFEHNGRAFQITYVGRDDLEVGILQNIVKSLQFN
jgi:hypothetical protein